MAVFGREPTCTVASTVGDAGCTTAISSVRPFTTYTRESNRASLGGCVGRALAVVSLPVTGPTILLSFQDRINGWTTGSISVPTKATPTSASLRRESLAKRSVGGTIGVA